MSAPERELLCPSARCEPGAILLGIVGRDGRVGYLSTRMVVDEHFVENASRGREPEKRFRFAQPCVEGGCGYWRDGRCDVVEGVVAQAEPLAAPLPRCSIRSECRWFAQRGPDACTVCPVVVTNVEGTAREEPSHA